MTAVDTRPAAARPAAPPGREFRTDIQGLRAVAVLAVLLYHADVPGITGGYVGVDVFFVISGFLITQQLLRTYQAPGRQAVLREFYLRRALRIIPASLLVITVTLVMARALLPPLELASIGRDGRASALYYINISLAEENTAYLADTSPSPFQHFWSLAVEEQFYIFWPALMAGLLMARRRARRRVLWFVLVASLGSFVLCLWLTTRLQPLAFFLLPTRAWEFGIGALLAIGGLELARRLPGPVRTSLTWLGLAGILGAAVVLDGHSPFPGSLAAIPVVGTGLVILGGTAGARRFGAGAVLRLRALQWIGLISYSLYLWHWPLLTIPGSTSADGLTGLERAGLLGLAVVLAALSYHLVEVPLRTGGYLRRRRSLTAVLGVVATAAVVLAAGRIGDPPPLHTAAVLPTWPVGDDLPDIATAPSPSAVGANLTPSLTAALADIPARPDEDCVETNVLTTRAERCLAGDLTATRDVVLFGDSHALQWFAAVDEAARSLGYRLVLFDKPACNPMAIPVFSTALNRRYVECEVWRANVMGYLAEHPPEIVFVTHQLRGGVTGDGYDLWAGGMTALVRELSARSQVVLIGDNPNFGVSPPACLSQHLDDADDCSKPVAEVQDRRLADAERDAALDAGAAYLDVMPHLCPDGRCPAILWNVLVYRDVNHVTATLAAHFVPLFAAHLPP